MKSLVLFSSMFLCSALTHAAPTIMVSIKTDYRKAAAVGFKVDGKEYGQLGKKYKHKGPANKQYHFGMRTGSVFGDNLDCGSYVLAQNVKVELRVHADGLCEAVII